MKRLFKLAPVIAALSSTLLMGASTDAAQAQFGIAAFDLQTSAEPSGGNFTQAGGHPYAITTMVDYNSHPDLEWYERPAPDADVKDTIVELPPGLVSNATAVAQCNEQQLIGVAVNEIFPSPTCPVGSVVGTIELKTVITSFTVPVYNMAPPPSMPVELGFNILGVPITLLGNVRDGGDFGADVSSLNIPYTLPLDGLKLTVWGDPADHRHDAQRCNVQVLSPSESGEPACPGSPGTLQGPNADPEPPAGYLTLPVSCEPSGMGMKIVARADAWLNPGVWDERTISSHLSPGYPLEPSEWGEPAGMTGCELVPFNPSVRVEPSNHQADTPTGVSIDFRLPQSGLVSPIGIATSDVRKAVVALPAGMAVSPSAASGLQGCSPAQIGLGNGEEPTCPDGSKLGSVQITTPLLSGPLSGDIYLAKQSENPFGSLLAIYLTAKAHGVMIKLAGRIDLDPVTGRLVTTVENSPQLPFEDLKIEFKGGPRSPLVNPHTCGSYAAQAELTPWSGTPPAHIEGAFQITTGPDGGPCPAPAQFAPGFDIGTTNNQAGAFSPLSLTMTRADGDQQLGGIDMHTPTGLLGTLSSVKLCPEPQASQGTCGPDSQIGTIVAGAGAGPNPFYVNGGKLYITGPYEGAPFGLSAVVPAVAGPFNLGTVVVRGTIAVDPQTTGLTITTDPLPTILQGIPLDLRVVNVSVDRPGFIFNPTNCSPMSIWGTLTGGLGLTEQISSSFQATNCGILGFKPSFSVATDAHHTRGDGASLDVKLGYPSAPFGSQANLAKVRVELPKQLPSRLTTLQKACTDAVFNSNPSNCPAASRVGEALATTPLVPVPLQGPAYFVSHGGARFPELIIVLSGYGVTVHLNGETFINKAGVTSTTFNTVPDVPVGSFELKLPAGPDSALAGNGDLCAQKLSMPTTFTAQNGAVIEQNTPVAVAGCASAIHVLRHSVAGKWATVVVSVPSAGRLVAGGGGVVRSVRKVAGAGTVTLKLRLSKSEQRFVAHHHGRRLRVPIRLSFKPARGGNLKATVAVLMR